MTNDDSDDKLSMDFEYCPACASELDTGCECLECGRDWRPWVMAFVGVEEVKEPQ
jgi:hypothetical protein